MNLPFMTKPLIPKVNNKFESLEAFEDAAKSAAKYEGFTLSRKDSKLTGYNNKSAFVVLQCTKATEKANSPEKIELYIQTWMKDSKMWIFAYTKQFYYMEISTTGRTKLSHSAFKQAIKIASDLESVFCQINQTMHLQHLKVAVYIGSNKIAIDLFTLRNSVFNELIGKVST
ncbi:37606_t:CDS:2 [Gigaspora margarita]|uniref:37606_t:CDS:1 n=1 Tax=Gigaspora margarita TaxID=4874 RepID=A0ABM8W6T2_GIGMA|nr:37606_t:CDS:2 [Gigaspora margarita]